MLKASKKVRPELLYFDNRCLSDETAKCFVLRSSGKLPQDVRVLSFRPNCTDTPAYGVYSMASLNFLQPTAVLSSTRSIP